jgi:hypothetical protein
VETPRFGGKNGGNFKTFSTILYVAFKLFYFTQNDISTREYCAYFKGKFLLNLKRVLVVMPATVLRVYLRLEVVV